MEMPARELPAVFTAGGVVYGSIEILWRGHTHWTMLLAGGAALTAIHLITQGTRWRFWQKWLGSAAAVLTIEFVTGVVVNLKLGWDVWDYSDQPYNLYGQVCLRYALLWLGLVLFGMGLSSALRRVLSPRRRSPPPPFPAPPRA